MKYVSSCSVFTEGSCWTKQGSDTGIQKSFCCLMLLLTLKQYTLVWYLVLITILWKEEFSTPWNGRNAVKLYVFLYFWLSHSSYNIPWKDKIVILFPSLFEYRNLLGSQLFSCYRTIMMKMVYETLQLLLQQIILCFSPYTVFVSPLHFHTVWHCIVW